MQKNGTALVCGAVIVLLLSVASGADVLEQDTITMSKSVLMDKIKGAWAAQTIGVTYGSPVEFKYNSRLIPDDKEIPWYDGYLKDTCLLETGPRRGRSPRFQVHEHLVEQGLRLVVQARPGSC